MRFFRLILGPIWGSICAVDKCIIFLDFDGVLNSCRWFDKRALNPDPALTTQESMIDPDAVAQLNRIIEATDCDVSISSAWRCGNTMGHLLRLLVKRGMDKKHWDKFMAPTPDIRDATRGAEIQAWLDGPYHDDYKRFVIIDDGEDMAHLTDRTVWTHGIEGLTPEVADEVIRRLTT